jgi:hypothetical protein
LTVSIRDYYATNDTRTFVLVDIVSNRVATLDVVADCILSRTGEPWTSFIGYEGRITVETMGSNRSLQWSNRGVPSTSADTISCQSIEGASTTGEKVTIKLR